MACAASRESTTAQLIQRASDRTHSESGPSCPQQHRAVPHESFFPKAMTNDGASPSPWTLSGKPAQRFSSLPLAIRNKIGISSGERAGLCSGIRHLLTILTSAKTKLLPKASWSPPLGTGCVAGMLPVMNRCAVEMIDYAARGGHQRVPVVVHHRTVGDR